MPAASHQPDKPFAIEPMLVLAEGLLTVGLFCLAPWFSWQGIDIGAGIPATPAADRALAAAYAPHFYTGWATALGIPIPFTPSLFFGYLWLIPLIGLAFVSLLGLRLRRLLSNRVMLAALMALSGLALLIEAGLLLQTRQFPEPLHFVYDHPYNHPFIAASVSWGFWGIAGVQAAAIAAGVTLLKPTLPGRHALKTAESTV